MYSAFTSIIILLFGTGLVATASICLAQGNTWTSKANMPTPRYSHKTCAVNGKIYASEVNGKIHVIGGSTTLWPTHPASTVFEYTPNVSSVEDPSQGEYNPEEFALHQNYPNPFNPETTIQYQVPKRSEVKLVISSLLGQRIATLVDEVQSMGIYSVQWDGKDDTVIEVPSGTYIYQIKAGDFEQTRKMVLLK